MVRNTKTPCHSGLVAFAVAGAMASLTSTGQAAFDQKILFIGNSYTYNALGYDGSTAGDGTSSDRYFTTTNTSAFEALVWAASGSKSTLNASGSQNIAVGGRSLLWHTTDAASLLEDNGFAILDQAWDYIVLQEYSTIPGRTISGSGNPYVQSNYDAYYNALNTLATQITDKTANHSTPTVMLYQTWARRGNDPSTTFYTNPNISSNYQGGGTAGVTTFTSYTQMYDLTTQAYANAASYLGSAFTGTGIDVALAAVGEAFHRAMYDQSFIDLYNLDPAGPEQSLFDQFGSVEDLLYEDDDSHQNIGGEFLSAAVLYEMLYGQSVLSLIDSGLLTQSHLTGLLGGNDNFDSGVYNLNLDAARYLAFVSQGVTGVPEPASVVLLGLGAAVVAGRRRRAA